jgi:opacity protein-like surface antigen
MMLNNYIDLPMNDNSKIFIGGGIGLARIKEKIIAKILEGKVYVGNDFEHIPNYTGSSSTKEDLNFAYSLMLGTSIKVVPNVNIEIVYSWKDFGVTKPRKWQDDNDRPDKNRYNGHSVMTGIRFDL